MRGALFVSFVSPLPIYPVLQVYISLVVSYTLFVSRRTREGNRLGSRMGVGGITA